MAYSIDGVKDDLSYLKDIAEQTHSDPSKGVIKVSSRVSGGGGVSGSGSSSSGSGSGSGSGSYLLPVT